MAERITETITVSQQADSAPHTWQSGGSSPTAQATMAQAYHSPSAKLPFLRTDACPCPGILMHFAPL